MKLTIQFLSLALLTLVSCKNKVVEKPDNLIPKERMTDILLDIALLNAAKGVSMDVLDNNNIVPKEYIYQKYRIDSLQFAESNIYYAAKPADYAAMYKEVEDRLKEMKEELNKAREDQRKSDSIRKANPDKGEQVQ